MSGETYIQPTASYERVAPRTKTFRALLLAGLFLLCGIAAAQTLSVGVVGGASLTQDFRNVYQTIPQPVAGTPDIITGQVSKPLRYIVGGMLELRLPRSWSVELDGLYHPLRYTIDTFYPNGTSSTGSPSPVVTFEFPVLAKYRFQWDQWRPFFEGGASFRTTGNLNGTNPSHYGALVGAGVETRLGRLRIAPEVRYIRWAEDPIFGNLRTRPDQVELLTSVSTAGFQGGHAFGPRVSLGVIAGSTLSPDFRTVTIDPGPPHVSFSSDPGAILVGATFEVAIVRGFYFEGDAFHQSLRQNYNEGSISSPGPTWNTWTFPLLGKYKFSIHGVKPFLEAGPAFRDAPQPYGMSSAGVTAGVGVEKRLWRVDIAPSVRFVHWGPYVPFAVSAIQPVQNQVEVLCGLSF